MTTPSTSTQSDAFRRYAAAHAKCQRLSGDALNKAQDEERDAIQDTAANGTIAQKVAVLVAVLKEASVLGQTVAMCGWPYRSRAGDVQ
jgi:hypothetical protein